MTTTPSDLGIAWFVSAHGFGHAARSTAIISALSRLAPSTAAAIYTLTPRWFFRQAGLSRWTYHAVETDVGLVQNDPLQADIPATIERLDRFLPFSAERVEPLAQMLVNQGCRLVVCDISPLGIAVARAAGIPSVLVENFTWDWIYRGYLTAFPGLKPHCDYLHSLFELAGFRIQTEPVCDPRPSDLTVQPVARSPVQKVESTRERLGIAGSDPMVLLTMGGIPARFDFIDRLRTLKDIRFVVPGGDDEPKWADNLVLLPYRSEFHHPDLVQAADAIVGKLGYSTLAEVYHAGIPFAFVTRNGFRESALLEAYVLRHMAGFPISPAEYRNSNWIERIRTLLAMPTAEHRRVNGAESAARFLLSLLTEDGSRLQVPDRHDRLQPQHRSDVNESA
jgi:hypothetical protein